MQVNCIHPSYVDTERFARRVKADMERTGQSEAEVREWHRKDIGITRLGTTDDVAGLIAFMVSPRGRWLHGATICLTAAKCGRSRTIAAMFCRSVRIGKLAFASALLVSSSTAVSADPIADFYKGKTISLIISSAEGGGYDIAGRVVTEYLSRHIPGNPTVIARNMPGASGMRAADYMFNVAARDGTVISIPQPTMLLNKVVDPSARYEPQGFAWIGRLAALKTYGVAWHAAPVQSVERARTRELIMAAAQGQGSGRLLRRRLSTS